MHTLKLIQSEVGTSVQISNNFFVSIMYNGVTRYHFLHFTRRTHAHNRVLRRSSNRKWK